jgi:tRNA nucleotidyltransferase (CCA-adding enzyme)
MQTYLVGGAVRDALLGRVVKDRDWVVVGSQPADLVAQGFVPVGRDFPVFLHPTSHEEYALARTERKTAPGYHGFVVHAAPDVSLEQDLIRRDLSINAIAVPSEAVLAGGGFDPQQVVDPLGGVADLQAKVFRHVSPAFREDPVRILRVARLAARFVDFTVAPETLVLMQEMVASGEVDHLVSERVWQELAKGLMEAKPSRMFEVLRDCGALARLLPEVDCLWGVSQRADYHPEIDTGVHLMMVLDMSARLLCPLPVRWACVCHDLGKGNTPTDVLPRHLGHETRGVDLLQPLCERLRVPTDCRELAEVMTREHSNIHRCLDAGAAALVRLIERCDALRRSERFEQVLQACECDLRGRLGYSEAVYPQRQRLLTALNSMQTVDTSSIASKAIAAGASGLKIGELIHAARVAAVQAGLGS